MTADRIAANAAGPEEDVTADHEEDATADADARSAERESRLVDRERPGVASAPAEANRDPRLAIGPIAPAAAATRGETSVPTGRRGVIVRNVPMPPALNLGRSPCRSARRCPSMRLP
jgi:hypothetical protein